MIIEGRLFTSLFHGFESDENEKTDDVRHKCSSLVDHRTSFANSLSSHLRDHPEDLLPISKVIC